MSGVQFNVDQALAKLGELVAQHGPQAVDIAAQVVRVNAVESLISGVGLALGAAGCALLSRAAFKRNAVMRAEHGDGYYGGDWAIAGSIACVPMLGLSVAAVLIVTNAWNWVALFNPKLALAHGILSRLGGF